MTTTTKHEWINSFLTTELGGKVEEIKREDGTLEKTVITIYHDEKGNIIKSMQFNPERSKKWRPILLKKANTNEYASFFLNNVNWYILDDDEVAHLNKIKPTAVEEQPKTQREKITNLENQMNNLSEVVNQLASQNNTIAELLKKLQEK